MRVGDVVENIAAALGWVIDVTVFVVATVVLRALTFAIPVAAALLVLHLFGII